MSVASVFSIKLRQHSPIADMLSATTASRNGGQKIRTKKTIALFAEIFKKVKIHMILFSSS